MYVGLKMLRNFVTVTPKTPVLEAQKLLEESRLGMLLVVEGGKLLGYVRPEDLSAALPSIMTSLDKHEIKYLMSKLSVERIIRKDIKTVAPEVEIEAAADLMFEKNLAGLAVVDHQGGLIGYINRSVMLDVLVEEMGHREGGCASPSRPTTAPACCTRWPESSRAWGSPSSQPAPFSTRASALWWCAWPRRTPLPLRPPCRSTATRSWAPWTLCTSGSDDADHPAA